MPTHHHALSSKGWSTSTKLSKIWFISSILSILNSMNLIGLASVDDNTKFLNKSTNKSIKIALISTLPTMKTISFVKPEFERTKKRQPIPKNAFDIKLLKVQELSEKLQDKARYIIEQIMFNPGRLLIQLASKGERAEQTESLIKLKSGSGATNQLSKLTISSTTKHPVKLIIRKEKEQQRSSRIVKVDSIGTVSADKPVTGYEAYFPDSISPEEPTLILEPQSQAIAGNGGTAISAPVSKRFPIIYINIKLDKKNLGVSSYTEKGK